MCWTGWSVSVFSIRLWKVMLSAVLMGFVGRQVGMPSVLTVRCCVIYKGVGLHSCLSWDAWGLLAAGWFCLLHYGILFFVLEARASLCGSSWPITLDASVSTCELSVGCASMSGFILILNFLLGMVVQCRVLCSYLWMASGKAIVRCHH